MALGRCPENVNVRLENGTGSTEDEGRSRVGKTYSPTLVVGRVGSESISRNKRRIINRTRLTNNGKRIANNRQKKRGFTFKVLLPLEHKNKRRPRVVELVTDETSSVSL